MPSQRVGDALKTTQGIVELRGGTLQVYKLPLTRAENIWPHELHTNCIEKRGKEENWQLCCSLWGLSSGSAITLDSQQTSHTQQLHQNQGLIISLSSLDHKWSLWVPAMPLRASCHSCSTQARCRAHGFAAPRGTYLSGSWHAAISRAHCSQYIQRCTTSYLCYL